MIRSTLGRSFVMTSAFGRAGLLAALAIFGCTKKDGAGEGGVPLEVAVPLSASQAAALNGLASDDPDALAGDTRGVADLEIDGEGVRGGAADGVRGGAANGVRAGTTEGVRGG
ncbi:MAG: hypothetical protein HYT87_18390, partial [Nitrospirae bacterium]|nr:hypothetical protein [Nitrospirota bacterium]